MAIAFFRIFEVKTPLLPVVVAAVVSSDRTRREIPVSCAQAAADRMPPSVGDHVLDHTEAAHPLPVVVPIRLVGSR